MNINGGGSISPTHFGNNDGIDCSNGCSTERAFEESKAQLDAIIVAESELKAAKDKYYKRNVN